MGTYTVTRERHSILVLRDPRDAMNLPREWKLAEAMLEDDPAMGRAEALAEEWTPVPHGAMFYVAQIDHESLTQEEDHGK